MNRQEQGPGAERGGAPEQADRERAERGGEPQRGAWADEAAQARTADDPRRRTPHDRGGVPSTGDESL